MILICYIFGLTNTGSYDIFQIIICRREFIMKEAKILLIFIATFAILFVGCTNPSTSGTSEPLDPVVSEMETAPTPSELTTPTTEKVEISIDLKRDEFLGKYASYEEFIEFDEDDYQKIVITTNVAVKDFKFIEIGFEEKEANVVFSENKVLYSLEELSPEKPFIVTWMEQGAIPHRGISFVDETNATRCFYIAASGEDGSLVLVEFENT